MNMYTATVITGRGCMFKFSIEAPNAKTARAIAPAYLPTYESFDFRASGRLVSKGWVSVARVKV